MKHSMDEISGSKAGAGSGRLGELGRGKSRADLAVSLPEGEFCTLQGRGQRIVSMTPVRPALHNRFPGSFLGGYGAGSDRPRTSRMLLQLL